jgi:hypothetical protein
MMFTSSKGVFEQRGRARSRGEPVASGADTILGEENCWRFGAQRQKPTKRQNKKISTPGSAVLIFRKAQGRFRALFKLIPGALSVSGDNQKDVNGYRTQCHPDTKVLHFFDVVHLIRPLILKYLGEDRDALIPLSIHSAVNFAC